MPRHPPWEPFADRGAAGRALAPALRHVTGRVVVLALPRGGVPVGSEVARALGAPLDVLVVRKLGLPGREELAMGAIASGGILVLDHALIDRLRLPREEVERVMGRESAEIGRRERAYRGDRARPGLRGATAVLVDDGLATGATMAAAVHATRAAGAARVVVAVPVGSEDACGALARLADEVVCLRRLRRFRALGQLYADFTQLEDADVRRLIAEGP